MLQLNSYKEFAAVASDLTASFITPLNCIKLRGVAKPALLQEFLAAIIQHAKKMELATSFFTRLDELQAELKDKTVDLPEEDLDLFEHQVDVLFTDFQLDLKRSKINSETSKVLIKKTDGEGLEPSRAFAHWLPGW